MNNFQQTFSVDKIDNHRRPKSIKNNKKYFKISKSSIVINNKYSITFHISTITVGGGKKASGIRMPFYLSYNRLSTCRNSGGRCGAAMQGCKHRLRPKAARCRPTLSRPEHRRPVAGKQSIRSRATAALRRKSSILPL